MAHWRRAVRAGVVGCTVLAAGWSAGIALAQDAKPEGKAADAKQAEPKITGSDSRYIRTIDDSEHHRIIMQSAARTFVREGKPGPTVTMCAAVHIGDKPFYDQLQALLDAKDVVLFETVKPAGTGRPEYDLKDDEASRAEQKVKMTKMRLRMVGIAARAEKQKTGSYPATLDQLIADLPAKLRPYIESVVTDAWGHRVEYTLIVETPAQTGNEGGAGGGVEEKRGGGEKQPGAGDAKAGAPAEAPKPVERIEVTSLGADGTPGGEGADADLRLSDQKPIRAAEIPRADTKGLQSEMAEAFGLVFQLDAMTHEHANWRNSDLSVDQVQERIAGVGAADDAENLFKMLDGSSFQAGLVKLVLGLMKMMPGVQTMGKVAMMEMLGRADDLLNAVPQMQKMMDVIIKDRNQVVVDDLTRIIEKEPAVKTVGIIYGGGHMPDLEKHLAELGYKEQSVQWLDAITVDIPKNKQDAAQLESIRTMVRQTIDDQVRAEKRKAKRKKAE